MPARKTPMRRVPLKGGTPLGRGDAELKRRVPLKAAVRERKPSTRRDARAPQAVRDAVYGRDLGWCVRCGLAVTQGGFSIHHRVLRSHGTDHSPQNQITLCGSGTTGCHGYVHAHPAAARAAGWMLPGNEDTDPAAEPVMVALPSGYAWFRLLPDGRREAADAPEGVAA